MRVRLACVLAAMTMGSLTLDAQAPGDTPYAASRLIGRWRAVMNRALEDARAFAPEPVTDLMEGFVSPGAVRAVQDRATEAQLQKADETLRRFVEAMTKAGDRQPDGSVVLDESTIQPAERAVCPVYPFCDR
jgi:hypothetical protein